LGDFVTPERLQAIRNRRGDDLTYPKACRKLKLGDESVVGRAAKSKVQIRIDDASAMTFERHVLANEFGLGSLRIVPCGDRVLEYGFPTVY